MSDKRQVKTYDYRRWLDHYVRREGPPTDNNSCDDETGRRRRRSSGRRSDAPQENEGRSEDTMPENVVHIGHPDDEGYPVETLSTEEFLENPRRLYHKGSIVAVCNELSVPYDPTQGDWVWADPDGQDNETLQLLSRIGFNMSARRGKLYHRAEASELPNQQFQFVTPEGDTE